MGLLFYEGLTQEEAAQRPGCLAADGQAALAFGPLPPASTVERTGASLMTDEDLLADLLLRWEELHEKGQEICRRGIVPGLSAPGPAPGRAHPGA